MTMGWAVPLAVMVLLLTIAALDHWLGFGEWWTDAILVFFAGMWATITVYEIQDSAGGGD